MKTFKLMEKEREEILFCDKNPYDILLKMLILFIFVFKLFPLMHFISLQLDPQKKKEIS